MLAGGHEEGEGVGLNALERRLEETAVEDEVAVASARADARRASDPLTRLPATPPREPKHEELPSYLKRWSPRGPEAHRGWGAR